MNHTVGNELTEQIPQLFPLANLIYPSSPQAYPHEFFTIQASPVYPTAKTAWFNPLETQLAKIPDLYN